MVIYFPFSVSLAVNPNEFEEGHRAASALTSQVALGKSRFAMQAMNQSLRVSIFFESTRSFNRWTAHSMAG